MTGVANFLFARRAGGSFVLRIDDTDAARSDRRFERTIRQDAEWLGLRFDEGPEEGGPYGPYRQSERDAALPRARRAAARLRRRHPPGRPGPVVFRCRGREVTVHDAARGDVVVPAGAVQDFVLLRCDGTATYTLATAVDDALMEITHVIRGEDHLTNTARQLLLMDALGLRQPRYAHSALLVDEDGHKLSKRTGAAVDRGAARRGLPARGAAQLLRAAGLPGAGRRADAARAAGGALRARLAVARPSHFDRGRSTGCRRSTSSGSTCSSSRRRVGQVLEQRGVGAHPAQLTALGAGAARRAHPAGGGRRGRGRAGRRRGAVPEIDAAGRAVAAFAVLRGEWPEPFLSADDAHELLEELATRCGRGRRGRRATSSAAAAGADRSRHAASRCRTWSRRSSATTPSAARGGRRAAAEHDSQALRQPEKEIARGRAGAGRPASASTSAARRSTRTSTSATRGRSWSR